MRDKKPLKWRGKPINSLSSTVNQKIPADQTEIKKEWHLPGSSFLFLMTGVSITALSVTFPVFSCTPLCLDHSAHWVASQRSIPLPLSASTRHSLLLLLLSLPLFHSSLFPPASLYFTSSHLLIDLNSFQGFPSALLPPSSSTDRSLLRGTDAPLLVRSLFLSLPPLSLSLSLPHPPLPLAFSHNFTFSHTPVLPTAERTLLSYSTVCTCPQYMRYF